ncbi:hypothetical protein RintRC_3432 [Richelia intracellularis]|nr:hypothetical protein RintRC_3432 [Richelia intracellularis]
MCLNIQLFCEFFTLGSYFMKANTTTIGKFPTKEVAAIN